jgi:PAS domain S-box-containing protein
LNFRLTLFPKLIIAFLFLSLPQILWLSTDATKRIAEVGAGSVERVTTALDAKARQGLEVQATEVANSVARFLSDRVDDLSILATLPKEPEIFLSFARGRKGLIWTRELTSVGVSEVKAHLPLYRELAWIDADGVEQFRIDSGTLVAQGSLRDVSNPKTTEFGVEDFFNRARASAPGTPYVGRLVGRHVGKAEQLAGAMTAMEAVTGKNYDGHIRFALAVREGERLLGVVSLALDHRHLMEFTQHLQPLSNKPIVFPSYQSGNYAFMFDDEGWIITHPKLWDIRGLDDKGSWVAPYSEDSTEAEIEAGRIPFNLEHAGFVHPNYPLVHKEILRRSSGVTNTYNVAGVGKVMAYAPIPFSAGDYYSSGVFGGVTIGALTDAFHREALNTGHEIEKAARATLNTGMLLAMVLGLLVLVAAFMASQAITQPVRTMAQMARQIASGDLTVRVDIPAKDEVGDLAQDLNQMAVLLEEKESNLNSSLTRLAISDDESRAYASRLTDQLRILRHIQSNSEFLGTTFDRQEALRIILRTCVEGLGLDRAVLYMLDPDGDTLQCQITHGFTPEEEEVLRSSRFCFSLARDDCAPVRVIKRGMAHKTSDDKIKGELTAFDREILKETGSSGFVYVPMKIRDSVVGALGADNSRSQNPIPDDLVGALQIVAGQAARSIEQARMYTEATNARLFIEAIFASLGSGLATFDPEGSILSLNPYIERVLGISAADAVGRRLAQCGVDAKLVEWVESLSGQTTLVPAEFSVNTPKGERIFAWVPSRFESGSGEGLIVQCRDVTDDRHMRKAIERIDRLASLGRMAAGVAHEIRNPITGVTLLLDDLHDRLTSTRDRELVVRSVGELDRMESIVQELLDYARVGQMKRRDCDMVKVLEQSLFLVNKQAGLQRVKVTVNTAPALPTVFGDPEKLKQALLNLYLNALQVMDEGGELNISAFASQNWVTLRVADTGPGIPPGEEERIFEPFFTLRPSGTGLGLSIAHTIISDHGGTINIEQAPGSNGSNGSNGSGGSGAVFLIRLPATPTDEIAAAANPADDGDEST